MCECDYPDLTPEEQEQDDIFHTFSYFSKLYRLTDEQKNRFIKQIALSSHYFPMSKERKE